MTAAGVVSSVTRPINLYYALVQAGLAITAVHTEGTYSFSSHGLKIVNPEADFFDIRVRVDAKQSRGGYEMVSKAVGSEVIGSEVSVGALWASLPDVTFLPLPGGEYPGAVSIIPNMPYMPLEYSSGSSKVGVTYLVPPTPTSASIFLDLLETPTEATDAWLKEVLTIFNSGGYQVWSGSAQRGMPEV